MMLLGGLFLNSGSTPDWLIWAKWLSPLNYGFEIVALNEYHDLTFYCTASQSKNGTCAITSNYTSLYLSLFSLSSLSISLYLSLSFSLSLVYSEYLFYFSFTPIQLGSKR